ncbi:hypothetical protein [Mycobacterium sp.]|uniref:hypothetical protein n=1 Tax=Mycobacterium sp. TaxID=1785 RepID=UPI003D09E84A
MTIDPKTRASQYTATSRRLVDKAGKIVLDANAEITNGTFSFEKWAKSASQLFDLALNTGLEMIPTTIPYPCIPTGSESYGLSDWIVVDVDNSCERALSVAVPFTRAGEPSCVIPSEYVAFSVAILPRGESRFRVKVTWPELRSGAYGGKIRLTQIGVAKAHAVEVTRTIDL